MVQFKNGSVNIFGKRRKFMEWVQFAVFFIGVLVFIWNDLNQDQILRHMDK